MFQDSSRIFQLLILFLKTIEKVLRQHRQISFTVCPPPPPHPPTNFTTTLKCKNIWLKLYPCASRIHLAHKFPFENILPSYWAGECGVTAASTRLSRCTTNHTMRDAIRLLWPWRKSTLLQRWNAIFIHVMCVGWFLCSLYMFHYYNSQAVLYFFCLVGGRALYGALGWPVGYTYNAQGQSIRMVFHDWLRRHVANTHFHCNEALSCVQAGHFIQSCAMRCTALLLSQFRFWRSHRNGCHFGMFAYFAWEKLHL